MDSSHVIVVVFFWGGAARGYSPHVPQRLHPPKLPNPTEPEVVEVLMPGARR